MSANIEFPPYIAFRTGVTQINEFAELTNLSYGLAQQLLFKFPKSQLARVTRKGPPADELSFSMADREVASVDLVCGWLTLDEYAKRVDADALALNERARCGELGPTERHPDTGEMLLAWPPEYQLRPREQLPAVGKNQYRVTLTGKARGALELDLEDMSSQEEFLRLAHALGAPAQVAERASEVLNRATLLLYWTAFEVFLRTTIHEMMRRHPAVLGSGKRGRETITYSEIATLSGGFSSAEQLLERLVARELEKTESSGESVHGLILYLKSQFRFETDPYKAWYVFKGQRYQTSFQELRQLKEARNGLVHDAGRVSGHFIREYPDVPTRDGLIVVSDSFLLRSTLLLDSLAFNIANVIENKKYKIAG